MSAGNKEMGPVEGRQHGWEENSNFLRQNKTDSGNKDMKKSDMQEGNWFEALSRDSLYLRRLSTGP